MAKRNTTTQVEVTESKSKKQQVLDYKTQHPDASPTDIVAALAKKDVAITAAHVSTILTCQNGSRGSKSADRLREDLKKARDFAKSFRSIDEAIKQIEAVRDFVDEYG